jgi:exonuclease III
MEIMNMSKLKIIHWNCNSINNKFEEFKYFLTKHSPDIMTLNETKINNFKANNLFNQLNNYKFIHRQRNEKNGAGGVAFIIKDYIQFENYELFNDLNIELLTIKITINKKELLIISHYNPPDQVLAKDIFTILSKIKKEYIIIGDLNAKNSSYGCLQNNSNGLILEEIIYNHDCIIVNNNEHTYYNFRNEKCFSDKLDLAICSANVYNDIINFEVLLNEDMTSDHVPIVVELKTDKSKTITIEHNNKSQIYNFNKANWTLFKNYIPNSAPLDTLDDVEKLNHFVVNSLIEAANKAIPIVYKNDKFKNHKTLPVHILQLIKVRKRFRRKIIKNNSVENKKIVNYLTNEIRSEINTLKNNIWLDFLEKQGQNPINTKPFWQRINKLKGKKISKLIPTLKFDDKQFETDVSKANLFAETLKNTFSDHNDEKFNKEHKIKIDNLVNNHDFSKHKFNNRNCFKIKDLNNIIKKLKNHAAPGKDSIHNQMLKNTSQKFRMIILNLINLTIKQNNLPSNWKFSQITMIPKKEANSTNPKDYRPISLTSSLAKISEKMIGIKLKEFLKENNIIIKQQSGFRNNRSTRDNICFMSQKIKEQFNRGKKACGVFFDIASAFDKVWHNGLLYKLIKLKLPNFIICWIKNFLENRYFEIKINQATSQKYIISAGVPQGAALSPILFSLFINDVPMMHKKNKDYGLLFADDLISLNFFKKYGNIEKHINVYLQKIENWLNKWRLKMAPQKCNFIIFSQNRNEKEKLKLKFCDTNLTQIDNTTFLGIRFDSSLTFNYQIKYLQESCLNRLNFLKVVSKRSFGLTIDTLNQLYISLIRSILEYSAIISPVISSSNFTKINIIQNKAIKIINKNRYILV